MISKHVPYSSAHDNYGALARYIADASHAGEKCLASWCAGCEADDDYELAIVEAQATQTLNTRSKKEKTYHLLVSFRPEDEARLSPEAFKAIEEHFAEALGFSEHQRHCGVHKNTNNIHLHIAYSMIHPERHTRHEPFRDYAARDKLSRQLERKYGLSVDNGRELNQENTLSHKAAAIEAQTGQESFESYAKRHKDKILAALEESADWQDLHESLKTHGLGIKPHGNGLVIIDLHGKHAAKASTVDRNLSAKRLQERFGDFQAYRSLRQIKEQSRYQAAPLHRAPERGELYAKYKLDIEARKARLESVKEQENKRIDTIRKQWEAKRREIERMGIHKRHRRELLTLARKHEYEAVAKAKLEFQPQRDAVRREIPFTSWSGFLRYEAENGDETALAILRSRKNVIESEQLQEPDMGLAKEWLRHGQAYAAIRADYATKERVLQERHDISNKSKRQLQAFLRMERIVAEASTEGREIGNITRSVDSQGVVIFALEGGGSIRDTGKKIFYSPQDEMASQLATLYAERKWGKHLAAERGSFQHMPGIEREIQEKELSIRQQGHSR